MTDWVRCSGCRTLVYGRRLARNLGVCPDCGRHHELTAEQRLAQLLDEGSRTPLPASADPATDPLGFVDARPYPARIAEARERTGLDEAVVCARGTIDGNPVVVAAMDFRFLGGSMGIGVGELVTTAAEEALRTRTPLLLVTASGGARMQEGTLALLQMVKTSQALGQLDAAGIPTISLITDPTYGGVAASYATLCDVIIAEPGARLGFAGPRVIAQTIRRTLPDGFQTAEFLLKGGFIDAIRNRRELRAALGHLLAHGTRRAHSAAAVPERPPAAVPAGRSAAARTDAWTAVQRARDLRRPTTLDYIALMFDDFEELRGDRVTGDCPAIVSGPARLDGLPVMVVGHQKGHDIAELNARNFGMPLPAGFRKAARLMRLAAKWGLPVITFVDTPGAFPGIEAEEGGQAQAIAESLRLMAGLPVPIVAVVTGEGGSGGALALAVANRVIMCENAVFSVISPEGCAAILWKDPAKAPLAAEALRMSAADCVEFGVADVIVPEPEEGAGADPVSAVARLRAVLVAELRELLPLSPPRLIMRRQARFRSLGTVVEEVGHA